MKKSIACQIRCLDQISRSNRAFDIFWQQRNRVKRILKRRYRYIVNMLAEGHVRQGVTASSAGQKSADEALRPGDLVRVRSDKQIRSTLDNWNQLRGCSFMEEMWPYCGTTQKVFKRIEKFLDERDYLMKQCKGIVILENVFCEGTKDFGACDRTCFFFWRKEWLEKIV